MKPIETRKRDGYKHKVEKVMRSDHGKSAPHLVQRGEVQLDPHVLLQSGFHHLLLRFVPQSLSQQQESVPSQLLIASRMPLRPPKQVTRGNETVLTCKRKSREYVSRYATSISNQSATWITILESYLD